MAVSKPSHISSKIWASQGTVEVPEDSKINSGWTLEVPKFQVENWVQNRSDAFAGHVNERGIAEWDATTNYIAGKSYVQGSNGKLYISVTASGPSSVVQDPVTDTLNTRWKEPFADSAGVVTRLEALEQFDADLSDSTSATKGATKVGYIAGIPNAVGLDLHSKMMEEVSVKDFGAVGDGVADDTVALQNARNYIAFLARPVRLTFPSGVYKYSASPNWAIQDAEIVAEGSVLLLCTGTSHAVILNGAGTPNGNIYNCKFGKFLVAGNSLGLHGVYVASLHHSDVSVRVIGAGLASAGMYIQFSVCTKYDVQVTKNGQPGNAWYNGAQPLHGVYGTELNPGELLSYCTFINPVLEHTSSSGMYLDHAFGNTVIGGTMEGVGGTGLHLTANAFNNKIYNVDFEVNPDHDVYCMGRENYFIGCDSETSMTIDTGANNTIEGGAHNLIKILNAAPNTKLIDLVYNRYNTGGIFDDGFRTRYRNLTNRPISSVHNAPIDMVTIVPTSSPFVVENPTGNLVSIIISGGDVSAIEFIRPGLGFINTGTVSGMFDLSPGDQLSVTYSTLAPEIRRISR